MPQVRSEIEVNEGEEMDPVKKMKSKQKGDGDSGDEEEDMDFKTRIGTDQTQYVLTCMNSCLTRSNSPPVFITAAKSSSSFSK